MLERVLPFRTKSAKISPMTLQNLKPCPEQAEHKTTCRTCTAASICIKDMKIEMQVSDNH